MTEQFKEMAGGRSAPEPGAFPPLCDSDGQFNRYGRAGVTAEALTLCSVGGAGEWS